MGAVVAALLVGSIPTPPAPTCHDSHHTDTLEITAEPDRR